MTSDPPTRVPPTLVRTLTKRLQAELLKPEGPKRLQRRTTNDGVELGLPEPAEEPSNTRLAGRWLWGAKFAMTGVSAMAAEACTFPIDITKTRMQLHGEGIGGQRIGFFACARGIVSAEGLRGMYRGVAPAIARHVPYTGTRIGLYEKLRSEFTVPGEKPSLGLRLALGFSAGGTAQAIAVPMDLIKVRMQADGRLVAAGKLDKPRYSGLLDALRQISAQEGVTGLWRGTTPAVQRAALVNLGELATYDTAKTELLATGLVEDNVYCHVLSAMCSGFFASLASTPADVVKTRLMNQSTAPGAEPLYKGTVDCFIKTLRAEGVRGLYKGFVPGWGRLGPWQLVFWVTFEQLRLLGGLGSF
jgi:solute carrier family 25 uncoupling protein 27